MATATRPGIEAQRQKIVEAAFALFGRKGLEDASVEDVLEGAGVSRQTFYRAFPGLSAVFAEVYRRIDELLTARLTGPLEAAETPAGWLGGVLDSAVDAAVAAGPALLALEREEKRPGSPFSGVTPRRQAAQAALIARWARERHGLVVEEAEIVAVLAASRELCLRLADPRTRRKGGIESAKKALRALAEGVLLRSGADQGLWTVRPRDAAAAKLLPGH